MNKNLTVPQMLGLAVLLWLIGYAPIGSEMTSNIFHLVSLILVICAAIAFVSGRLKKK